MFKAVPHSVSTHTRIRKTYLKKIGQVALTTDASRAQVIDAALTKYFAAGTTTKRKTKAVKKNKK